MSDLEVPEEVTPTIQKHDEVTRDLRDAIEILRSFAQLNVAEPVPHCHHLDLKAGHLIGNGDESCRSLVGLARCFVTALLSDNVRRKHERHRDAIQNELLKAIDIVKNSYPLLDKLKEGDDFQQKLADKAVAAIEQFNKVINIHEEQEPSWGQRVARFFFQHSGLALDDRLAGKIIELPLRASSQCHSPHLKTAQRTVHRVHQTLQGSANTAASRKVSSLAAPLQNPYGIVITPTNREVDAFRVKAVTMIRNYGFPSTSLCEALKAVRQAPVQGASAEESPRDKGDNATIVTFRQTLQPFPGEVIVLEGSFRRDEQSMVASVPIPDSFRLFSRSSQTGFPHPIQHNGWALSDKLLPPLPDTFERLPLYRTLYQHKRKIAVALLPQGRILPHAKELLALKEEVYKGSSDEFLKMHRRLALAMIWAAGHHRTGQSVAVIDAFFKELQGTSGAMHQLAQIYQRIGDVFIAKPTDYLQEAWVRWRATEQWKTLAPAERYVAAKQHFTEESERLTQEVALEGADNTLKPGHSFLITMGRLINDAAKEIVLQYMSEKMGYTPESLTTFAQKIQCALFKQLMTFLVDLEHDHVEDREWQLRLTKERLVLSLEADITRFEESNPMQGGKSASALAAELDTYYRLYNGNC